MKRLTQVNSSLRSSLFITCATCENMILHGCLPSNHQWAKLHDQCLHQFMNESLVLTISPSLQKLTIFHRWTFNPPLTIDSCRVEINARLFCHPGVSFFQFYQIANAFQLPCPSMSLMRSSFHLFSWSLKHLHHLHEYHFFAELWSLNNCNYTKSKQHHSNRCE